MKILHLKPCCQKGFREAKRLWKMLIDAGVPSTLESTNGFRHKNLIEKFCLNKDTKLPIVILDDDVAVNCKDLTDDYCKKIVEGAKRGLDQKDK